MSSADSTRHLTTPGLRTRKRSRRNGADGAEAAKTAWTGAMNYSWLYALSVVLVAVSHPPFFFLAFNFPPLCPLTTPPPRSPTGNFSKEKQTEPQNKAPVPRRGVAPPRPHLHRLVA